MKEIKMWWKEGVCYSEEAREECRKPTHLHLTLLLYRLKPSYPPEVSATRH